MPQLQDETNKLKPGDFYEDCRYHPMVAVEVDYEDDSILGISLVTGQIGSASLRHCGVVKLSAKEALTWRLRGPQPDPKEVEEGWVQDPDEWENAWWKKEGGGLAYPWWDPEKELVDSVES